MNIPHVKYDKGKVEGYKRRIQEILGTLDAPNSPLGENLRVGGCAPHLVFVGPHSTATTFVCESGTSPNFDPPAFVGLVQHTDRSSYFPLSQPQHSSL